MRTKFFILLAAIIMFTAATLASGFAPAHAGGGATIEVKITSVNPHYVSAGKDYVAVYMHIHAYAYQTVPVTLQVFFKKVGSNDYLRNGQNYVVAYKTVTPSKLDWSQDVTLYVPYGAFPAGSRGKSFLAVGDALISSGQFPNVQNEYFYSNTPTFTIPQQQLDNGSNLVGVSE